MSKLLAYQAFSFACAALLACGTEVIVVGQPSNGEDGEDGGGGSGGSSTSTSSTGGGWEGVGACGGGLPGPDMVEIRRDDGSGYCINSTEVTKADFAKFFDEGRASYTSQWCEGIPLNSTVALVEEQFKDPARADFPSTHGDWCDWEAYCAWAGKRLCGGRDGAHVTETTPLEDNELLYACTKGGEQEFPYGATHEPARCNDRDSPGLEPIEVATADCEGGFPGLFDLAGNVGEAINNLVADDDTLYGYRFVTLGGDYLEKVAGCSTERPYQVTDYSAPMSGFRCCRTLE